MADERTMQILLVEDDQVDVMTIRRAFEKNKILNPLYVASNGIEALAMLREDRVPRDRRLVLLDLNMPGMNGIEFLRELRADPELRPTRSWSSPPRTTSGTRSTPTGSTWRGIS